jgi:diguanylate cyclase (GGDEF)-like protein
MNSHEPIEATEKLFTRTRSRDYRDWAHFGIFFLIIAVFTLLLATHRLDRLEDLVRDGFLKHAAWKQTHPDIALVEISETAIDEIGPWPWPRSYHAIIARLLSEWKAAALVFDLDLSETMDPKNDSDLAQALSRIGAPFYFPADLRPQKEKKFWVHGIPVVLDTGEGKRSWVHALPEFEKQAQGIGHGYLSPDPDGVLRRFDPVVKDGKEEHLFLPLRVASDYKRDPAFASRDWKSLKDSGGKVLIPWNENLGWEMARYSCSDLIHSFYALQKGARPVIDPGKISGKICLIGPTASGAAELKMTPLGAAYPKVNIYAQVLNAALTGNWIRPVPFWGNLLCLLGVGALTMFLFVTLRGAWFFIAGLSLAAGWFLFCFLAFTRGHLWFYAVYPALLILCLFIFSAIYVQIVATREKSHLFHLATRDGLTELYVIRHFRLIMNQIVREASLRKEPLSVILLDIDNFKSINDTYGHPAGDMVLKKTASIILHFIRKRRPFREIDFAARYGGEEFIIMLRKAGLREAASVAAERIREKIEETRFEWEGKLIRVTASLGVAFLHQGENVPDSMVHRADAALYKAKASGKNRVCTENR